MIILASESEENNLILQIDKLLNFTNFSFLIDQIAHYKGNCKFDIVLVLMFKDTKQMSI